MNITIPDSFKCKWPRTGLHRLDWLSQDILVKIVHELSGICRCFLDFLSRLVQLDGELFTFQAGLSFLDLFKKRPTLVYSLSPINPSRLLPSYKPYLTLFLCSMYIVYHQIFPTYFSLCVKDFSLCCPPVVMKHFSRQIFSLLQTRSDYI